MTLRRLPASSRVIRPRPDRLFERFRRTGDPRLLAQVFDATAPELWRVAAHLCRDVHAAEDAVQGSFLTALEARASWDAQRPLLPWLLGHLANRVREQRRRSARVLDAARLERAGERDPADVAADREVEHTLRGALERLDEPYRSTLERHLVHGMAAAEIAAEFGVAAGTVRMRLHRGLEQLRQKLPAGLVAGGAVAVQVPAASLLAMRQVVLGSAPGAAAVVGSGHAGSFVIGVLLMSKVFWTVLASGLLLVSAWWAWPASSAVAPITEGPVAAAGAPAAPVSSLPASPEPGSASAVPATSPRVAVAEAAPNAARGLVQITLRNAGDGRAVAGADLEILDGLAEPPKDSGSGPWSTTLADAQRTFRARSNPDGICVVELRAGWASVLLPDLGLRRGVEVQPGDPRELRIDVPVRLTADVRVVDVDDRPVPGARLVGSTSFDNGLQARDLGRADADGRFTAPFVEPKVTLRAVHDAYAASMAVELDARNAVARLCLGSAPATIAGTVFGPDGAPLADSQVALQPQPRARRDAAPLLTRTDGRGCFECANVPAGRCLVVAMRLLDDGSARLAEAEVDAAARQRTMVDVRFDQGAALAVHLALADGAPVAAQDGMLWLQRGAYAPVLARRGAAMFTTDADGRATVRDLLPGRYQVQFAHAAGLVQEVVDVAPGETRTFEHVFGGAAGLVVRVVDPAGKPLAGWTATLVCGTDGRREVTDADGRAVFRDLQTETGRLTVQRDESSFAVDTREVVRGQQVEVRVDPARTGTAGIRGVLVAGAETPLRELQVMLVRRDGPADQPAMPIEVPVDAASGAFEVGQLNAGSYGLFVIAGRDYATPLAMRESIELAGTGVVDLGTIATGTGRLVLRATFADGRTADDVRLCVGSSGSTVFVEPRSADVAVGHALPEGSYHALVWGAGIEPALANVDVHNGAVTELPVVVRPAAAVTVSFAAIDAEVGLLTVRPNGQPSFQLAVETRQPLVRGLAAGHSELELDDLHGHRFTASVTVGSDLAPVEVALRRAP